MQNYSGESCSAQPFAASVQQARHGRATDFEICYNCCLVKQKHTNELKHQTLPLMGGDASRVGKIFSYYFVLLLTDRTDHTDFSLRAPTEMTGALLCPQKAERSAHISALRHKCGRSTPLSLRQLGFTVSAFYYLACNLLTCYYMVLRCSNAAFTKSSSGRISLAMVAYFVASTLLGVSMLT